MAGSLLAQAPTEPTTLYVDSDDAQAGTQGDPVNGVNTKPYFSAIFNHNTPTALAEEAKVQFATDSAFTNIVATSSWKQVANTAVGARIPDIQYTGSALACVSTYYWRIRIKDTLGIVGPWSTETASFSTVACPHDVTTLYVGNDEAQTGTQGNPVTGINTKPVVSGVMVHDSATALSVEAKVQFATDAAFANIVGTSSWKPVDPVTTGNRISDVEYNGTALACNTQYYWRIKIKDDAGVIGPWSTEAASFVTINCPEEATTLFIGNSEAQTGTQGDPVTLINIQPYCSAIVTHSNPSEQVVESKVQFALDAAFDNKLGTSSWKSITPTTAGNRCSDVRYNGQAVPGNTRVYWRIRFKDAAGVIGNWSTEAASFETVPSPVEPSVLFVDSTSAQAGTQGDPVTGIDLDPVFSAIFNHNETSGIANRVRVQVALDSAFTNEVWLSAWESITATADGARTPDVAMPSGLLANSATYYWRVRIEDTTGNKGPWSIEAASFTTTGGATVPPAVLGVSGFLQGTDTVADLTKTGGAAFPAGVSVAFDTALIEVLQTTVTGPNTLQLTIRTGNRTAFGAHSFQVMDGQTAVAEGDAVVFHPLQRQPERIGATAQEALNSPMILGAGVLAIQGEFVYGATDVSIRGRQLPLMFRRSYRSFLGYNGATGQSWSSVVDASMRFSATLQEVEWLNSDGRISTLVLASGGQSDVGPYIENGRYVEWLRYDGGTPADSTDDYFVGTGPHGGQTTYSFGGFDTQGEAVFRLVSHQDRFGNTISYVRDALGQLVEVRGDLYESGDPTHYRLALEYEIDGRLKRIQDYADYSADAAHLGSSFLGPRVWDYLYDDDGNLTEVRGPATNQHGTDNAGASGRTRELYSYLAESGQGHHLMQDLFLPVQANLELSASSGVPWLRNEYDASSRVVGQDLGALSDTDDTHRWSFKYAGSTVDEIDPLGRRMTATLDTQGRALQVSQHTGTYELDQFGVVQVTGAKLRATDPGSYDTTYEYNQHGELTRQILPRGNERRWLFDDQNSSHRAKGNLLRSVALPGTIDTSSLPASQQNGLLVTYAYGTTYNLPTEEVPTDAFDLSANFDITQSIAGQVSRDDTTAYRTVFEYDGLGRMIRITGPAISAAQSPGSPNVGQQMIREYQYNAFGQVTSSTDASTYPAGYVGVDFAYEYGASGFDKGYLTAKVTDPSGLQERTEFTYDSVGNLRTIKAVHGAVQTTIRDQLGRVVKSMSPPLTSMGGAQYTVDFTWDQNGNLAQRVIHDHVLDAQGLPTAELRDITQQWGYGVFGNLITVTDSVTSQTTRTATRVYDVAYQCTEQLSPGGTKSVHTFDELGRPFQSFFGLAVSAGPGQAIASTTFDYDLNSNIQRVTDPRGFQRTSAFDAYDRLATTTDARTPIATSMSLQYSHGPAPAEASVVGNEGGGNAATLSTERTWFDNNGRVYRVARRAVASDGTSDLGYGPQETLNNDMPGWQVTTTAFLPDGRVERIISDLLNSADAASSEPTCSLQYDSVGRVSRTTDAEGNFEEIIYVQGRVSEVFMNSVDSNTQVVQTSRNAYEYDELSRVISSQACTQLPVLTSWNAQGQVVRVDDPARGLTQLTYDLAGRLTKSVRSASQIWSVNQNPDLTTGGSQSLESRFEYDLDDNLTRSIDNGGNQTLFAYDLLGRVVETTYPNGGKVTVGTSRTLTAVPSTAAYYEATGGYDASGNLLHVLDEGDNQIDSTYSNENELTFFTITKGAGSQIAGINGAGFDYDGLGRVVTASTSQFGGGTHLRQSTWNSLSLLESYSEQIDGGSTRTYYRSHDESGRTYQTQSPDAIVKWVHDKLGRVKTYTVERTALPTIHGAWAYQGNARRITARATAGDRDNETRRDQRGRITSIVDVSRVDSSEKQEMRYLIDPDTGRTEGILSVDRPVPLEPGSRLGLLRGTSPVGHVFGERVFFDGLGRVTGMAHEVTYPSTATDASNWGTHPDTQASAFQFDSVSFASETGIFLGDQLPSQTGMGHLNTPHTNTYGTPDNPLPIGQGTRQVPTAIGDVALTKTSDDQLKIAEDGMMHYTYDYLGRLLTTKRLSDDSTVDERKFDSSGVVYDHMISEYELVTYDFSRPDLGGLSISTGDYRLDGGGLKFTSSEEPGYVAISFPGDIARNGIVTSGGRESYHDFLIQRDATGPLLASIYFTDYQAGQFGVVFKLVVEQNLLKLYSLQFGSETLLAQGTLVGPSAAISIGVRIETSNGSAPVVFRVFSNGSQRLSYSYSGAGQWAPTQLTYSADVDGAKLYRYSGYLDLDFTQADLRQVENVPDEWKVAQLLCGSGAPTGQTAPSNLQDLTVMYQLLKDAEIESHANGSDVGGDEINGTCGTFSASDPASELADMEDAITRAYGFNAALQNAAQSYAAINQLTGNFEYTLIEEDPPADLDSYLAQHQQNLLAPRIAIDPYHLAEAGAPISIPFVFYIPYMDGVHFEATGPNGAALPEGMTVTISPPYNVGGALAYQGQVDWTPAPGTEGTQQWIYVRALAASIQPISFRAFAEGSCLIEVLPAVVNAPIVTVYDPDEFNYYGLFDSARFGYGHSQEEYYTDYHESFYVLSKEGYGIYLGFAALSDTDTNYSWSVAGLVEDSTFTPGSDTAQVVWSCNTAGLYDVDVTATNSFGSTTTTVHIRVMPDGRDWNVRGSHIRVLSYDWEGQQGGGAVWGSGYAPSGYYYLPWDGVFDAESTILAYVSNENFTWLAGEAHGQSSIYYAYPYIRGPEQRPPAYALLSRTAVRQQQDTWLRQGRDVLDQVVNVIGGFAGLIACQLTDIQRQAEEAKRQAEEARKAEEARLAAEAEWDFLGMHRRKGGIEFGDAFAIEWDGYLDRGEATWGGAVFMAGDTLSYGAYYSDEDRGAMLKYYAERGLGSYYLAGGVTGAITVTATTAIATGGASTFSTGAWGGVFLTRTAAVVRTTAGVVTVAETGYSGYQAGAALGDVANGGEWTIDTTLKVGAFGVGVGGVALGRLIGKIRAPHVPTPPKKLPRPLPRIYPPNAGFAAGEGGAFTLRPGTYIDRIGSPRGHYAAPAGTNFPMRSLPWGAAPSPYNVYEVVEPFTVIGGRAAPWFGQPGGGVQFALPYAVEDLLRMGLLRRCGG